MPEYLTFDEASEYLAVPKKYLENYVKVGGEISLKRVGRRKMLSFEDVNDWKIHRDYSTSKLNRDHYRKCLEFAIRSFYDYSSTSDFGTSQQRDAGKFISNFVIGKLGEISVANFLKRNFDIDTKLDFDLRDAVVGQDITEISKPRRGARVYNPPKLRIAIKTSKMKNVWLIVGANEAEDNERASDIYIFSRVDLYLNHFVRILKEHPELSALDNIIPAFQEIDAEVCGFIDRDALISSPAVTSLPSPHQDIQLSYIKKSGTLKKTKDDWTELISSL